MTAMMIDHGKRVAAGGARLQWHTIPIADIDLIARNTRGEENGSRHRLADVEGRIVKALKRTKEDVKDVQKPKVKFRSKKRQYERFRQSPRIPQCWCGG